MSRPTSDPYEHWLGIPPGKRPPDHYQLLGISRFESNEAVIVQAAQRQLALVQQGRGESKAEQAASLLREIAAARDCLLDAEAKQRYDRQLRERIRNSAASKKEASKLKRAKPLTSAPMAAPPPSSPLSSPITVVAVDEPSKAVRDRFAKQQRLPYPVLAAVGIGGLLGLLLLVGLLMWGLQDQTAEENEADSAGASSRTGDISGSSDRLSAPGANRPLFSERVPLDLPRLIERLEPSVVKIEIAGPLGKGIGSGFLADGDGTLVTNFHVVRYASNAQVMFADRTTAEVRGFLTVEPEKDLAVLRIVPPNRGLQPIRIAAELPRKGARVLALGAPRGLSFTPSEGIVSAVRSGQEVRESFLDSSGFDVFRVLGFDEQSTWIQSTAPISPGNSGGPLVNMQGELVGVNTWSKSDSQNLNFAISAKDVREILGLSQSQTVKPFSQLPKPAPADSSAGNGNGSSPWSIGKTRASKTPLPAEFSPRELARFTGHRGSVSAIAVSPDGRYIATAGDDRYCHVLDAKDLRKIHSFGPHGAKVTSVSFIRVSADTTVAVSTEKSEEQRSSVLFWSLEQEKLVHELPDANINTYGLRIAPNQARLAVTMGGHTARLYFVTPFGRVGLETGQRENPCRAVAFSPDSRFVLMGSGPKVIVWVFDEQKRGPDHSFAKSSGSIVNCIDFPPGGNQVYTGHDDGILRSWDFHSGQLLQEYQGHQAAVTCLAVSASLPLLATGSQDATLLVWDLEKGAALFSLKGHSQAVTSVAMVPGPEHVVSASQDGTVRLWAWRKATSSTGEAPSDEPPPEGDPFAGDDRIAVPDDLLIVEARRLVRDVFGSEFDKANGAAGMMALAKKLLAQAEQTEKAEERYALLAEAGRLGIEAGDVATALQAAEEIGLRFDVDGAPMMVATLESLAAKVRGAKDRAALGRQALAIADEVAEQRRFDLATKSVEIAMSMAVDARDGGLLQNAKARAQRAQQDRAAWDHYQRALKTLASNPGDGDANLAAGTFLCVHLHRWPQGLPHLADCSDEQLSAAARRDLSDPAAPADQVGLGDSWWERAQAATSAERHAYAQRAAYWYRRALPGLSSLQKLKVENSLRQIEVHSL